MEVWVNPDCSKCRAATAALDEAGVEYTVRRYLDEPPTLAELRDVVTRLGVEPWDVARLKEAGEAGIDLPRDPDHREEWLEALVAHPRAIQRPIVTADDGSTTIARDTATVSAIVEAARG